MDLTVFYSSDNSFSIGYNLALVLVILLRKSIIDIQQWKNGTASKQSIKILQLNGVNPHIAIVQALQTFFYKKWQLDRAQFDKERLEKLLTEIRWTLRLLYFN